MFGKYGHRKKKILINLPFNLKKEEKTTQQPQKSQQSVVITKPELSSSNPETIPQKKPSLSLKSTSGLAFSDSISIKKTIQPEKTSTATNQDISIKPTESFTTDEFSRKWTAYKKLLLNEGKSSLASIFEELPLIEESNITITLENKALDEEFNSQKTELLDFLRKELKNYNISIETTVNKDVKIKKAYTPQEKFMKMSEKNPALINLAKAFDAEVGYPID